MIMTVIGLVRDTYQGWEPILAQTMLPKASSPTTDSAFNFFDSFNGFTSLLQQTSVVAVAFWAEVALGGAVFEDTALLDWESFEVLLDNAFSVAVDEDGVGAGDNDAGRLVVEDGEGDEVTVLLSFPDLPKGDFPILAGEPPVGVLLYVPENLQ